jgi:hypothetical protein
LLRRDYRNDRVGELYGCCLLDNRFHLLARPTGATISGIMQSLLASHTQRCHRRDCSGDHVWQGRFKSTVIQNDVQQLAVLRYGRPPARPVWRAARPESLGNVAA